MLYLVQSDVGTQVRATITENDTGDTVDISGATTVLKFRKKGASTVLATLTNQSPAGDSALGIATFIFGNGVLNIDPGNYEGEIESTFSDGSIKTVYEKVEFFLREDF
jgi:hypothetical protein